LSIRARAKSIALVLILDLSLCGHESLLRLSKNLL
jgi:hypothetical protein